MKRKFTVFFVIVLIFTGKNIKAQDGKFQAVFIFNFYKQMEWPSDYKGTDFIIGVLGDSDVTAMLEKLTVSKSGKTNFVIKEFSSVSSITKCNMIYIPEDESDQFDAVQKKLSGTSTLLITEKAGLGGKGAGINFVEINDRLKFELNETAISKANIQVSDMLKSLAILI
jgi:hypothetical protein